MHHRAWVVSLAAALPLAGLAADEALLKAALIVRTFDHYAAACQQRGGFKSADATAVKAWEREHGVAQIRARIPALERDATQKQQLDRAVDTIVRQIDAKGADACTAAVTASRTRERADRRRWGPAPTSGAVPQLRTMALGGWRSGGPVSPAGARPHGVGSARDGARNSECGPAGGAIGGTAQSAAQEAMAEPGSSSPSSHPSQPGIRVSADGAAAMARSMAAARAACSTVPAAKARIRANSTVRRRPRIGGR